MKKFLFLFLILFTFSFTPRAHATVVSYSRTPSTYYIAPSAPIDFYYETTGFPSGTVAAVLFLDGSSTLTSSCVSYSGVGSTTLTPPSINFVPYTRVYLKYYNSISCGRTHVIGTEDLEYSGGSTIFDISSTPGSCSSAFSDDYCFFYLYFTYYHVQVAMYFFSSVGLLLLAVRLSDESLKQ